MREIKFRAWDKSELKMFYDLAIYTSPFQVRYFKESSRSLFFVLSPVLMQYTGLKGMYEGDIISDNIGNGVIEYVEKYAAFRVNYFGNSQAKWFYDYLDSEMKTIEIIGNIHEHKHLQEQTA